MARAPARQSALDALVIHGQASGRPHAQILADVAAGLIQRRNLPVDPAALPLAAIAGPPAGGPGRGPGGDPDPAVMAALGAADPDHLAPDLLGQLHEALLDPGHRRRRGVFYTPPAIAAGVAGLLDWPSAPSGMPGGSAPSGMPGGSAPSGMPRVCDPAVGGGAFLLAAARVLAGRGYRRADIVEHGLWGVDVDPAAAAVAGSTLVLWAAETGRAPAPPTIVVGDSLVQGADVWNGHARASPPGETGFDVVLGNPPFQNQLGRCTARPVHGADAERLRRRFEGVAYRYTDSSALFLLEACRWARPGGQVALVLPQSMLVAEDAAALRRAVLELGHLERLWVAGELVFAASVRVCVPVLRRISAPGDGGADRPGEAGSGRVEVLRGRRFTPVGSVAVDRQVLAGEPSWAILRSGLLAAPAVDLSGGPAATLGSFCSATAGFRDQFYDLAPFVREAAGTTDARPRLVTCGLLEPARCLWGQRVTRFAGRRWSAPVVDLDRLGGDGPEPALPAGRRAALAEWSRQRLVPKVVVATQTRVLEAAVDEHGAWFPSVPTIALTCPPGPDGSGLWEAAAVVMAPATSAWAFGRHSGAALSDDALKVSARQLLELPLPAARAPWREAAGVLRVAAAAADEPSWRRALGRFGLLMGDAYGVGAEVLAWWEQRLPVWR
jgi:hypothetical protein